MGKSLVIVESPAKAKTINKFLGKDFIVKASMGHVRDLPKKDLGVDEETFEPTYQTLPDKKKTLGELKKAAKGADEVAARIRELGGEHHVPLLEAPPLARALYRHVDIDREIPGPLYTAVAEVLVWAFRLKRAREEGGDQPVTPADLPIPAELEVAP